MEAVAAGLVVAVVVSVAAALQVAGKLSILTENEHASLTTAIQSLERKVTGELVVIIADASDTYRYIPTLWAALAALVLPAIFLLSPNGVDMARVYTVQVTLFFGLFFLFQWGPVLRCVVPQSVMRERASRYAHEQFLAQGLHQTKNRCGALVFISLMEHHIEIMADKGVADNVDNGYWKQTINSMAPLLKQGKTTNACSLAIEAVEEKLMQFAQRKSELPVENVLPDRVIEL